MIDELKRALTSPQPEDWPIFAALVAAVLAIILLLAVWIRRRRRVPLARRLAEVSHDQLTDVVLPKADDGAIHIEHILLTERGILIVDARDIAGVVFGSDRMHDWTIMDRGRRFTIGNPQAALYDRVAAVKLIVTDVPVEGRIVFGAQADFSKGVPSYVCTESELLAELPRVRGRQTQARKAFAIEWQRLRDAAMTQA